MAKQNDKTIGEILDVIHDTEWDRTHPAPGYEHNRTTFPEIFEELSKATMTVK